MRATTINDESLNYGELQYINANNSQIVFLTVGCITMVAIAQKEIGTNEDTHMESVLRIQLEYVYTGIIFTLTDAVQYMLNDNPYLDVREMLGSTDHVLRRVLNSINMIDDQPFMFLGGVHVFGPVPSDVSTINKYCSTCHELSFKTIVFQNSSN